MEYLPLFFDLKNRPVLLVGGGDVALRKARLLTRAGALIHLIAPEVCEEVKMLVEQKGGQVELGKYRKSLLQGRVLVVAATDYQSLNESISFDARSANVPVNVVDSPALCTFIFPAIVDRSPIVVGISSAGKAPVLARNLRARLETLIPQGYADLGALVGRFRQQVKQKFSTVDGRRLFWEKILSGPVAEKVFAEQQDEAEQLLRSAIEAAEDKAPMGEVYLVGAGPGDPELLTFKALRLMQQADVVLYDALVSPEVVDLCRRDADLIFVGKRRDQHTLPQEGINELLVKHAKQGKRVVRLKGGDPFIFGRGGEELQTLSEQGVPFQVVPGITAASACSSYSGIPLTHRDFAQSVRFVTGQLKSRQAELDFSDLLATNETLVFYMGLHTLPDISAGLISAGRSPSTPVAIVSRGTCKDQRVLTGTLSTISDLQESAQLPAPSIIIVGEVVKLHSELAWFGDVHQEANHALEQVQQLSA
ncbi:siroheme synthase CysG [Marinobacterium sp. xm-d-564]|uniref:siroheme synthase CysG n=1 Tax=Marinobacterium sp. xm-d-564 TaxID=2497742 RepID=UPI001569AA03|nr:siroheme synthase CysG [Marinobacterium sp. xm-d-564]NRP59157.1 Siroheme synthase [Marinobacterium sp. xm-d-564]